MTINNDKENITHLLKWVCTVLNIKQASVKYDVVIQTPWSVVIKIDIDKDSFYLKQTPADLYIESDIIDVIKKHWQDSLTSKIIFRNRELNCFLMNSCGEHSLRTKFNGVIDGRLLFDGLQSYINVQRALEKNVDDFLTIGVPDWRIGRFPDLFLNLLQKKELLLDEGLTSNEIDQLIKLVPNIKSTCQFLSEGKIKETLVNCDFNENNMIMNERTQQISIIDWGESVISHPFLTITAHLQRVASRYQLEIDGLQLESIKQKCLACWADVANKNELDEIYQNVIKLHPIFFTLSIYRLQEATNNTSKQMQRWFIKEGLQMLLKNEK